MSEEEIKSLLHRNLELAEENNRILRGMRRRAIWGTLFTVFLWLVFVIIPAIVFYLYAEPYINQMQEGIKSLQHLQAQLPSGGSDTQSFIQKLYNDYMSNKSN